MADFTPRMARYAMGAVLVSALGVGLVKPEYARKINETLFPKYSAAIAPAEHSVEYSILKKDLNGDGQLESVLRCIGKDKRVQELELKVDELGKPYLVNIQ